MENIVLIGMPASGKSTLGVVLAKALGMDFVDTDLIIQRTYGKRLQDIIRQQGLSAFMRIEEEALTGLELQNSVISTGGSAVYSDKAMTHLKKNGRIVYLHVPYKEIDRRLKNITTRGIVMNEGSTLLQLYNERLPLYQRYAHITIDCTDKSLEQCVDEIIRRLRQE